jgi:hypothetical protein
MESVYFRIPTTCDCHDLDHPHNDIRKARQYLLGKDIEVSKCMTNRRFRILPNHE